MESDPWTALFSSKRHQSTLQSRSDLYFGFEEIDGDDDSRAEFPCPFCSEDFDIVGLCCHIDDEHPVEAKNGVCPVCAAKVGMDMVGHITMQHGQFFKEEIPERFNRVPFYPFFTEKGAAGRAPAISSRGSSCVVSSSNAAPDPLLTSFIYPVADASKNVQPHSSDEGSSVKNDKVVESVEPSLSDKDLKEKAQKCEFIQELLLSTFLDDAL